MTWLSTMEHHSILCHFALLSVVYLSGKLTILLLRIDYKFAAASVRPTALMNQLVECWCQPANEFC